MKSGADHVLPRDIEAEHEALRLTREIFDKPEYADDDYERKSHVVFKHDHLGVTAEARSALLHGSRFELAVRGDSSAEAARMLVYLLRAYREKRPFANKKLAL